MKTLTIAIVLATALGACVSHVVISFDQNVDSEADLFFDLLSLPILPERYKSEDFKRQWGITSPLTSFKWEDCGGNGARISAMSISPDPIKLPGKITVSFEFDVTTKLDTPIDGQLTIEKKVLGLWIPIPCIGNVGSCAYKDVCENLKNGTCPPVLADHGIPCHCPFNTGTYTLPASEFDGPDLPSILVSGDYRIVGQLFDTDEKMLACLNLELSLANGY